jgi:hypothetical protein
MSPPNRATTAGRVYLDLRNLARRDGRSTQELLTIYVLERFLYRLAISQHRERLVLKGGMLLAALGTRRPTADIDLLALALDNDRDAVVGIVLQVLDVQVDDGVIFELGRLTAALIRGTEMYAGVRLAVPARLDRAQVVLRLDVNVGDPVTPEPVAIDYPTLLAGSFRLLGYPLATVLAEKIITMIDRGATTTRERDFADILLLTRRHPIDAKELRQALMATALHRQSQQRGLASLLDDLGLTRQRSWVAYSTAMVYLLNSPPYTPRPSMRSWLLRIHCSTASSRAGHGTPSGVPGCRQSHRGVRRLRAAAPRGRSWGLSLPLDLRGLTPGAVAGLRESIIPRPPAAARPPRRALGQILGGRGVGQVVGPICYVPKMAKTRSRREIELPPDLGF